MIRAYRGSPRDLAGAGGCLGPHGHSQGQGKESCRHQLLSPAPAGSSRPALPATPADGQDRQARQGGQRTHQPLAVSDVFAAGGSGAAACRCRGSSPGAPQLHPQHPRSRCRPPPTPAPLPSCRAWRIFTKPITAATHPSSPRDLPASSSVMSRLELQEKRSTAPYSSPASAGGRAPSSYAPRFFQYRNILGPRPGGRGGRRCCPRCRVPGGGWLGRPHGAVPTAPAPPGPPVGLAGGARLRL